MAQLRSTSSSRSLPEEVTLLPGADDEHLLLTIREVLPEGGSDGVVSGVRPPYDIAKRRW